MLGRGHTDVVMDLTHVSQDPCLSRSQWGWGGDGEEMGRGWDGEGLERGRGCWEGVIQMWSWT